jgi:hypothetical protein
MPFSLSPPLMRRVGQAHPIFLLAMEFPFGGYYGFIPK